jgi:hypothetical protein
MNYLRGGEPNRSRGGLVVGVRSILLQVIVKHTVRNVVLIYAGVKRKRVRVERFRRDYERGEKFF